MDIAGKKFAIVGLGKSGLATVRFVRARGGICLAWDDDANTRTKMAAALPDLPLTPPDRWDWRGIAALVLSPGIPHSYPAPHQAVTLAQQQGVKIIGDIALLVAAAPQAKYIGITGTNGKSTTTALIGFALRQKYGEKNVAVGGNLGIAALDLPILARGGIYVLELSSYQLELNRTLPLTAAVLLNISPDHLDRHGGLDGYIAAKTMIFEGLSANSLAVIAIDDDHSLHIFARHPSAAASPASHPAATYQAVSCRHERLAHFYVRSGWIYSDAQALCDLSQAKNLPGIHNAQNAVAAFAVLRQLGMSDREIAAAFMAFPGLAHRQENVGNLGAISFINDSKATNADAAYYALVTYQNIYWLAGGRGKEGGINGLDDDALKNVTKAFLFGESADEFAASLTARAVAYESCGTMQQALAAAFAAAQKAGQKAGGAANILLSPAAASFDQFANFEDRGDQFRRQVQDLIAAQTSGLQTPGLQTPGTQTHPPQTLSPGAKK
ncbi:MAG: UDP-N-acetylmuramoyl-L-alanine--D-glutamate ligase [Candidatus Symbiobacter sp.]|nr:UDP-N-acetylmuramoyl-L-alanine--D-glutamate ligase [Candidatus Symbiobacter sp.]